jgi:hypothetical protein
MSDDTDEREGIEHSLLAELPSGFLGKVPGLGQARFHRDVLFGLQRWYPFGAT